MLQCIGSDVSVKQAWMVVLLLLLLLVVVIVLLLATLQAKRTHPPIHPPNQPPSVCLPNLPSLPLSPMLPFCSTGYWLTGATPGGRA